MGKKNIEVNEALFFDKPKGTALIDWMELRLRREAGLGVGFEAKIGGTQVKVNTKVLSGLRLKNMGVGVLGLAAVALATKLATGVETGFVADVGILLALGSASKALDGSAGAWRQARSEGKALLPAFGSVCRRASQGLSLELVPNGWTAAAYGQGLAFVVMDKAGEWVGKSAYGAGLSKVTLSAAAVVGNSAVKTKQWADDLNMRKRALRIEAARVEGASNVSEGIYEVMAKGWLCQSLMLSDYEVENDGQVEKSLKRALPPKALEIRKAYKRLINEGPFDNEAMEEVLELAHGAGVEPWFKPAQGLPSVAELAKSFALWRSFKQEVLSEKSKAIMDEWSARVEAKEILGVVGDARPFQHEGTGQSANKKVRL